ncbi:phosphate ABC transporter permease subunit PstC [Candidatus Spyradosoma sp. SGI.093]|uniref:phosphate ABC transporter permease subunit PstC n=1 Tax=Candidatus Spyradosoma sp. SGI.093 TaxID=3420583 RepID=UPI003CFBF9B8
MIKTDDFFKAGTLACAGLMGVLAVAFFFQLSASSADAWREFGLGFLWSSEWDPVADRYGALPSLAGTLLTTAIALVVALPLSFVSALYLTEAHPAVGRVLGQAIDLLAAIPSVIYGMWGFFVLVPLMQNHVKPFFTETLGAGELPAVGRFLGTDSSGYGFLTAGLILALMILPYICAIMRDVFKMTPPMLRESAFGVGCTRWETAKDIVMKYGIRGLLGGVFVGLGRALGETMAVLFVIGNLMEIPNGVFDAGTTIAATLANNFAEAQGLQQSVLFALGLILLSLSFAIQVFAQYYLHRTSAKRGER